MWLNISREGAKTRRYIKGAAAWVNIFISDNALLVGEEVFVLRLEVPPSRLRAFA
jgi:hypothetical protein